MKYLTVGKSEITRIRPIIDPDVGSIKPKSGLWLTKYISNSYNEWINFLINDPMVFYYKGKDSLWDRPCSLVTIKEDAKILCLDNLDTFFSLKREYPLNNDAFSYVKMSSHYDGIYIDMYKLLFQASGNDISAKIYKFGVNSLVLFNARPIDYYQSGRVLIEPYDFEYNYHDGTTYEIKIDNEKKKILK